MGWKQTLATLALPALAAGNLASPQKRQADADFDWSAITPSSTLQYHDCYDGYKCARLKVPLDWTKSNASSCGAGSWAAVGIVTLPATVPDTDPAHGGTILVNPGGPGGAGTKMVLQFGAFLQQRVLAGDKSYEILGFDPRGMGFSTPSADCYRDDLNRASDTIAREGFPPVSSDEQALSTWYQASLGLSELCGELGPDSIFNHMSTASVARDMLEIVERVDELRYNGSTASAGAKLQYYGLSYGTQLGNTFASMFPSRVGRMVLDGVADADDFLSGNAFTVLNDAETLIDHFYDVCFEADACALKTASDESAADIRGRVDAFIAGLIESPIATVNRGRVRLITSSMVRESIRQTLYSPIQLFEFQAVVLADALAGNFTLLLETGAAPRFDRAAACAEPMDAETGPEPRPMYNWGREAAMGVFCGDSAHDSGERDLAWARTVVQTLEAQSPTGGEPWSHNPLSCAGWPFRPPFAFRGPFGHLDLPADQQSDTAPIMIVSTRYDQATPLANAVALAEKYPGSGLLVQESYGHTALFASPSSCTFRHLQRYFATGEVPEDGATCEPDCEPSIPFKACPGFADEAPF